MFTAINGGSVVLRSRGVYRTSDLYRLAGQDDVFAKYGGGYIRLIGHGATTVPHVNVSSIVVGPDIGLKGTRPFVST